ncbi:MAG: MFS transporter [bacterium]|nr:MFS transporter [bacterium]
MTKSARRQILFPLLFACFTIGFTFCASTIANYFGEEFKLDNFQLNVLPLAMFIWYLFIGIPISKFARVHSNKKVILIGLSLMTAGIIALILSQNFWQAILTFVLLGLGNVMLQVIYNPLLTFIAPKNEGASFMILRQITEAITGIVLPLLLIWSNRYLGNWRTIIWASVILAIIAIIWLSKTKIPQQAEEGKITSQVINKILHTPGIVILLLGIVTIGGFNNSLMTIVPRLLVERTGIAFSLANLSNTVFFALRLIGEIIGAFLLLRVKPWKFFNFMSLIGVLAMAVLLFIKSSWLIFAVIGITGFVYSSLTSLIFAQVLKRVPQHQDAASGLVITSWSGASFFSLITGIVTKITNTQTSGVVFFLLCSLFVLYLGRKYTQLKIS